MTEIERIQERTSKALEIIRKDIKRLFEIVEERNAMIDELARKVEAQEEKTE